jgi:hypothetical protein
MTYFMQNFMSMNMFISWSKQIVRKHPRYLNVASVRNFVSSYVVPDDVEGLRTISDEISEDDWLYCWLNTVGFEKQEVEWITTRILLSTTEIKVLRIAFNAPWYISNKTLHNDSGILPVEDEIKRLTNNYVHNLTGQPNVLTSHLLAPPAVQKRLHRTWPTDVLS